LDSQHYWVAEEGETAKRFYATIKRHNACIEVFEEKILSRKISEAPKCWAWRFFLQNRRLDFRMTAQHNSFDSRVWIVTVTCFDFGYLEVSLEILLL
jgi:hypothetical protein